MSTDRTKILNGPVTYDVLNAAGESILTSPIVGREYSKLSLDTEEISEEAGDYTTEPLGEKLKAGLLIHELDTSIMDDIEDPLGVTHVFDFPLKDKRYTIAAPDHVKCLVKGGKCQINIEKVLFTGRPYSIGAIPT